MEYKFSVIMTVYNELYLRETVDSLIGQTIGFETIQLIILDNGSTDNRIIRDEYAIRYPENILVIHKETGGVSSVRNTGLTRTSGRYIVFMTSGDMVDQDLFSKVFSFFEENTGKMDVASVPVFFFDDRKEHHPQDKKFRSGSRIVDLDMEWSATPFDMSGLFFAGETIRNLSFDETLHYSAESKFIQECLIKKHKLGVMASAHCYNRVQREKKESAMREAEKDPDWYLPRMSLYFQSIIDYYKKRTSLIPKFIQYALMQDIQEILLLKRIPAGVISRENEREYLERLSSVIKEIDDDVIMSQKDLKLERKMYALRIKHGNYPEIQYLDNDVELSYAGIPLYSVAMIKPRIEFIRLKNGQWVVEGWLYQFPQAGITQKVIAEVEDKLVQCDTFCDRSPLTCLNEPVLVYQSFRISFPAPAEESCRLRLGIDFNKKHVWLRSYSFERFSGLTEMYKAAYCICGSWCVRYDNGLVFRRIKKYDHWKAELRFLWELATSRKNRARRAAVCRAAVYVLRLWKRRPLWLISDRELRAGDNGEVFFRYMVAAHPEIDTRFVLLKESPEYAAIAQIGKVIPGDSRWRKLLQLASDYVISSQPSMVNTLPFHPKDEPFRDMIAKYRFIFLQHGVIENDLPGWLGRKRKNIFGFVTSAWPEFNAIINGQYGYSEKEVWLTGLPRFDLLDDGDNLRQITIMPTWRRYLMGEADPRTLVRPLAPEFFSSAFLSFYNDLLNNERLLHAAEKYGYTLAFFPHPELQPYLSAFQKNDAVAFLGPETAYREVYAKSALVLTDYTSAVFDFAYLRRPVLYAQFDRADFFSKQYSEGYFDFLRDGFGEVEYDLEHTVDRIIEYMADGCLMKDEYRSRADRFFAFDDRNSCQRVYEKLIEAGTVLDQS